MSGVQRSVSADADPINDDRAWRGQHGQILAGIVLIGHQRGRLVGLVEGLAEEAVPGGGRGLERGSWVQSVFGQQCDLAGDVPAVSVPASIGTPRRCARGSSSGSRCRYSATRRWVASEAVSGRPRTAHSVGVQAAPVRAISRSADSLIAVPCSMESTPARTRSETISVVTCAATRPPAACTAATIASTASRE